MNQDRARRLQAKKEFKKPVTKFEKIDLENCKAQIPKGMNEAYRNTRHTVMIYHNVKMTIGTGTLAMIQKHDNTPIINHWQELQKIKNEIFGAETTAVEFYPAESQLENVKNIYWLWIFPEAQLPIPIL
jgi:hypothetical protein